MALLSPVTNRPRPLGTLAAAVTVALVPLLLSACGGDAPATPRTTTVTITPTPTGTSTSSTTTTPTTTPPKTYAQAMQHFAAGKVDVAAKAAFTSPTGNIYCSISSSGGIPPGCEVGEGRITPPAGTCDTGGGGPKDVGRIEWSGDTPKPVCNGDTMFHPGMPVLQYGTIATAQGSPFQCLSENIGMTCINTTGKKGFFLAKGVYQLF